MRLTEIKKKVVRTLVFEHLLLEAKNTHLTHLEDLIYKEGYEGAKDSINYLNSLYNMLKGNSETGMNITTKWDGSPAVFVGTDPADGKFFVGTKGVFNRNPKLNKSLADIEENHADVTQQGETISKEGLREKLRYAFTHLQELNIQGVLQGDLLFTDKDISEANIKGEDFIIFKPNTLIYAVPKQSDLANEILSAKIGVVFHTEYKGATLEDMDAKFGFNAESLTKTPNVWFRDATIKDVSGMVNLTAKESKDLELAIAQSQNLFNSIDKKVFDFLENTEGGFSRFKLKQEMMSAINAGVIAGTGFTQDPQQMAKNFIQRFTKKMKDAEDSVSNPATKEKWIQKEVEGVRFLRDNIQDIMTTYQLYLQLIKAKELLRNKLTRLRVMDTFTRTEDGSFEVVGEEGFVAVDKIGNAIKLVDRLDFSNLNFQK